MEKQSKENDSEYNPKPVLIGIDDGALIKALKSLYRPDCLESREMVRCVWSCVTDAMEEENIDPRARTAFYLFFKYGFKLREIAELFNEYEAKASNRPGSVLKKIIPRVRTKMANLGYAYTNPEPRTKADNHSAGSIYPAKYN